ncbi:MAG: hypothetical protein HY720_13380 [Planctomycetes bacterium]|nr:hypothetical protein [Planctomycetota bacterium]
MRLANLDHRLRESAMWGMLLLSLLALAGAAARAQSGPYGHVILSASSADGLEWTLDEGVRVEHASVPCAVVRPSDGAVLLYFVDAADVGPGKWESANVAVSTDGVSFEKQGLSIEGRTHERALDPSIVLLPDGRFRLYYFSQGAGRIAENEEHEIHSAVSTDGIRFVEEGVVIRAEGLVDPDVFRCGDAWLMYVFSLRAGGTRIARSDDGTSFRFLEDLGPRDWGTTAPVALGDGRFRLYAFDQRAHTENAVASFVSRDGISWEREPGVRLRAPEGKQFTDPFVVVWKGGYRMYLKTEATPRRRERRGR